VSGLGEGKSQKVNGKVLLTLQTKGGNGTITAEALILQKVTGMLPNSEIDISKFTHIKDVNLADNSFYIPQRVDLLLGADVYHEIVLPGNSRTVDGFRLIKTKFGDAVSGPLIGHNELESSLSTGYVVSTATDKTGINKYWEEEEIVGTPLLPSGPCPEKHQSEQEKVAEKFYKDTTKVSEDGRIVVKLPFKPIPQKLGYSYAQALKRLENLRVKFKKDPVLGAKYTKCFQELIDNHFVERVPHSVGGGPGKK
jgi:hypothetical protein